MKYYGQFDPPVDQYLHERFFLGRRSLGLSIECGAYDGLTESSCKFFEESLGWRSVNVEAYPVAFEQLKTNRPSSLNVHAALSDRKGTASFTAAIHPELGENFGNGSIRHTPEHRNALDRMGCTYRQFEVPTMTYGDLVEALGIGVVDLFVLDVEGHEQSVLEGMRNVDKVHLPRIFCIEHGNLGLDTVRTAVEPLGYVFDSTSHVNAFFLREDFPQIAKTLFSCGKPQLAWDLLGRT